MIRMSGMNSGLDTESIINALTANTKLKATKQERNVLKYEATQEAYRDIISKMQGLKNKYFDILNKDTYIAGNTIWNKYASKVYAESGEEVINSGISVATTVNSNPGEYKVNVNKTAKQAQLKGNSLSTKAKIDTASLESGKEYGFSITVGDTEKNITFIAGDNEQATVDAINAKLREAFGESNDSSSGSSSKGMVYIDDNGQLAARNGKGITMSGIGTMTDINSLDLTGAKSGTNKLSFQVGDEVLNVAFQSISHDYFDSAVEYGIINDQDGSVVKITDTDEDGENIRFKKATEYARAQLGDDATEEQIDEKAAEIRAGWSEAVQLYQSVTDDLKESTRYDSFKEWKAAAEADGSWQTKLDSLYAEAEVANKETRMTKWLEADDTVKAGYNEYKDHIAIMNLSQESKDAYEAYKTEQQEAGEDVASLYDWAQTNEAAKKEIDDAGGVLSIYEYAQASAGGAVKEKYDALNNKYEGTTETETELRNGYANSVLSDETKELYNAYKAEQGDEAVGIYEWAQTNASDELQNAETSYDDWKSAHIEDESWHLSKSSFENSESSLFTQYKKSVYNEEEANYDLTKENVVDHFTQSALKNSIGNLETSDGTKFEVTYDKETDSAVISAYKENTTTDDEGNEVTTRTPVSVAMTVASDSVNNAQALGATAGDATTAISQITNSTKLSDIGATADEDGNYNFSINGVNFSFSGDTTVNDMMKKVNASTAGVKMTYSSLDNAFSMTASKYGVDSAVDIDDKGQSNLLTAIGLKNGTFTKGENLEVEINGKTYQSNGNTIEADGSTFTISGNAKVGEEFTVSIGKDTSAIKDLIKDFVKEYNQLIEDVYKYLDEKPEKDYYFLADADKEDLDLSEKQEEKWEEKAKKGLLYHDSTTTSVMTSLRTALMGSIEGLDGNVFSLSSMGLKTSSDYSKHGMFANIDEKALDAAIETHLDDIEKLFTDSENGIMKKFSAALDAGVKSTGDNKGSLIRKAGLSSGTSATDNELYNAIKRTKSKITSLNKRYESEQNRLWKRYSSMESLLGTMNSQQSQFMSYFQ